MKRGLFFLPNKKSGNICLLMLVQWPKDIRPMFL